MKPLHFTGERLVAGERWLQQMRVENLARFQFFVEHAAGQMALDLGCGAGEGTAFLRRQTGWRVVGVDVAGDALAAAKQEYGAGGAAFACMDAGQLAFAGGSFDGVISVEVIEHLRLPEPYLAEAARVLRAGGLFMLTTPNRLRSSPTPGSLWPEHVREYDPDELSSLLRRVFKTVELWGEYVPVFEAHPARRLMRRLAPFVKPWLPHYLRVRALPVLQSTIKSDLSLGDVRFTQTGLAEVPTLVALCRG